MKFAFFSHGITDRAGKELIKLIEKDLNEIRVVYITTAANTYPPDPEWLVQTKNELSAFFSNLETFDLEKAYKEKINLEDYLSDKDLIFFSGGNTFYLLYWIRKTKFDRLLKKLMEKGVVYGGESAGVVCQIKDLKAIGWLDKPEESPEPIKEGLNFTNIVALPHWNNPKYKETLIKVKDYYEDKEIKVHTIEDGQAIFVDGKKITKFE